MKADEEHGTPSIGPKYVFHYNHQIDQYRAEEVQGD
jgi:hypothetical protein